MVRVSRRFILVPDGLYGACFQPDRGVAPYTPVNRVKTLAFVSM